MAAKESLQRYVEKLHENLAYVVAYPFLEYIHQEASVLFGTDRALGDQVTGLRVEQALPAGLVTPALVGNFECLCRSALDDRDELHPLCAQLIAEEAIHRTSVVLVGGIDRAKNIKVDGVPLKGAPAIHH